MNLLKIVCNGSSSNVHRRLVLLVGAAVATCLSGCFEVDDTAALTKKRDDYQKSLDYQIQRTAEAEREEEKLSENLAIAKEINASMADMLKQKRALIAEIDDIEARLESSMALLDSYRKLGERHSTAIVAGEVLGDLTLKNGVQLKNATVTKLRDEAIGIKHASGVGFYPINELPSEIQKQFLRPPSSSLVATDVNPRAVLLRKPDSLKTPADASADRSARMRAQWEVTDEERQEQAARYAEESAARAAENEARMAEYEKKAQKRREINAKVSGLRGQISAHEKVISTLESAIRERRYSMNYGTTRTSEADQRKILAGYEQKIASYSQAIAALEAEIAKLQAGF